MPRSALRILVRAAVVFSAAGALVLGCSRQSEGERCDHEWAGATQDCNDGLVCTPSINVRKPILAYSGDEFDRVVRVKTDDVKKVESRETILVGGRPIAFVRLGDVLNLPRTNTPVDPKKPAEPHLPPSRRRPTGRKPATLSLRAMPARRSRRPAGRNPHRPRAW